MQIRKLLKLSSLLILVTLVSAGCIKQSANDSVNVPEHIQQPTPPPPTTQTTITYAGVDGKNALELLKMNHQITTKTFSGVGEFVETINGAKPDEKHFWAFYVNGKSSNVGADQYQTKSSDTIEWKLEEIK